jgi:hypothetical protein
MGHIATTINQLERRLRSSATAATARRAMPGMTRASRARWTCAQNGSTSLKRVADACGIG